MPEEFNLDNNIHESYMGIETTDPNLGLTTDPPETDANQDATGISIWKGLLKILASVWVSAAGVLKFRVQDGPGTDQSTPFHVNLTEDEGFHLASGPGTASGNPLFASLVNPSIAVTQSGVWSVGRTWTTDALTDSMTAWQGGAWTVQEADGANVALGATADLSKTDSALSGTLMSFTKGVVKILADVWDAANHWMRAGLQFGDAVGEDQLYPTPRTLMGRLQGLNHAPHSNLVTFDTDFIQVTAIATNKWLSIYKWTMPNAYFVPLSFSFTASDATYSGRVTQRDLLGTWTFNNAFTPGFTNTDPFWGVLHVKVLTGFTGGVNPVVLTINYLNQDGNPSSTTVTFNRASAVNAIFYVTLASSDIGVQQVTGVSNAAGYTSGSVELIGTKEFSSIGQSTSNQMPSVDIDGGAVMPGRDLNIAVLSSSGNPSAATVRGRVTGYFLTGI